MGKSFNVIREIPRVPQDLVAMMKNFSTATIYEAADRKGALPYYIKPIKRGMKICGPAVTVSTRPGDNLIVHKAVYVAEENDVLIVSCADFIEAAVWGGIMTEAAIKRGIVGLITDGGIRDTDDIIKMGFPTFSQGISIKGTTKTCPGFINYPITMGNVEIQPGDLVVGDSDGVVVVSRHDVSRVLEKTAQREENESRIIQGIKQGKTTLELFGFTKLLKQEGIVEESEEG